MSEFHGSCCRSKAGRLILMVEGTMDTHSKKLKQTNTNQKVERRNSGIISVILMGELQHKENFKRD